MKSKSSGIGLEILLIIACSVIWAFRLKKMLFAGQAIPIHDAYYWEFPLFHFFSETLIQGQLPLWNPYTHGGEPFYPLLVHLKFLDPVALLTVGVGKYFSTDSAILLGWYRYLQTSLMVVGAWMLLRRFAQQLTTRLSVVLILFFSSIFVGGYRQHGIILLGAWVPFIALLCVNIFSDRDYRTRNFLLLGWLIGMQSQSYYYLGVWVFLALAFIGCLIFERKAISSFLCSGDASGLLWTLFVVVLMSLPNLVLFSESKDYVYPARMLREHSSPLSQPEQYEEGVGGGASHLDYQFIKQTGTFSTPWDFLQILSPHANRAVSQIDSTWGEPSEAYLYLGVFTWCLALIGIFWGTHPFKKIGLTVFILSALLLLGPAGGIHQVLYWIFPLIRPMRHTASLVLLFEFSVLYFFVIGMNRLNEKSAELIGGMRLAKVQFLALAFSSVGLAILLITATQLRYPLSFSLYLGLLGGAVFGFILWKIFDRRFLFWTCLMGQVLAVYALSSTRTIDILRILIFCCLPLLFLLLNQRALLKQGVFEVIVIFTLVLDLGMHLESKFILNGFPHPKFLTPGVSSNQKMVFPKGGRQLYSIGSNQFFQAIRYLELLRHETVAFSATERGNETSLSDTLKSRRWNSLLSLKHHWDLVHSNQSTELLSAVFRLGSDPIDLGEGANYEVTQFENGYLNLRVQSPTQTKLYWADGYHSYWKAKVDGVAVPIERARMAFKQVDIAPGQHRVEFSYCPTPFLIAASIFLFLLVMVPMLVFYLTLRDLFIKFKYLTNLEMISTGPF